MAEAFHGETPVYVQLERQVKKKGQPLTRVFLVVGRHRPYYLGEYDVLYARSLQSKIESAASVFSERLKGLGWDSDEWENTVHRLVTECEKACN